MNHTLYYFITWFYTAVRIHSSHSFTNFSNLWSYIIFAFVFTELCFKHNKIQHKLFALLALTETHETTKKSNRQENDKKTIKTTKFSIVTFRFEFEQLSQRKHFSSRGATLFFSAVRGCVCVLGERVVFFLFDGKNTKNSHVRVLRR